MASLAGLLGELSEWLCVKLVSRPSTGLHPKDGAIFHVSALSLEELYTLMSRQLFIPSCQEDWARGPFWAANTNLLSIHVSKGRGLTRKAPQVSW